MHAHEYCVRIDDLRNEKLDVCVVMKYAQVRRFQCRPIGCMNDDGFIESQCRPYLDVGPVTARKENDEDIRFTNTGQFCRCSGRIVIRSALRVMPGKRPFPTCSFEGRLKQLTLPAAIFSAGQIEASRHPLS